MSSRRLREIISRYRRHSQELDFIPSLADSLAQLRRNRFRCVPRNSDLLMSSSGEYLYCYNDAAHRHTIGDVQTMGVREALECREAMGSISELCDTCNMRSRYGPREITAVAARYLYGKAQVALFA